MLKEIVCDAFKANGKPRGPITFHKGLNTILGGAAAENSIGKSTFLLVIDFCFGGSTYAKADVKNYTGDHTVCFTFEFADGLHHYSRSLSNPNRVNICNEKYEVQKTIKLKDFTNQLLVGYGIDLPGVTFRDIVSRFFRAAGKKNDTVNSPLNNASPSDADAITAMEKLFDMYRFVEELKKRLATAQKKKTTYSSARRLDLVPSATRTKTQYQKNESRIRELLDEKATLTQDTDSELLQMEMQRKDAAADVATQLKVLRRRHGQLLAQYRVITKNKDEQFVVTEDDLQKLLSFFPDANIRRIEEVETFHRSLSGILDSELSEEAENLQLLIKAVTGEIQRLEKQIVQLGVPLQIPQSFLERYSDIERQIAGLRSQNEAYSRIQEFKDDVTEIEGLLADAEEQVLRDIESALNAQMVRYNDFIYEAQREAPTIRFESKSKYDFTTPRDGGTGTAYKSLIVLDMSVLKLTSLPIIAHDSSIFKNIGDDPVDRIMELYLQSEKQIFIAFDKAQAYTERTAQIVNDTAVLRLNPNGEELFGWCWAIKGSGAGDKK